MVYEHLKKNNIDNIGCVLILDDIPHLFITKSNQITEGIPLDDDDNGIYDGLGYNDIILVGVNVLENSKSIDPLLINEDNVYDFEYKVIPLYLYTLQTVGLVSEDILDLDLFEITFDKIIKLYEKEKLS